MAAVTSEFARFVEAQAAALGGPLPLAHTTDAWGFRYLLEQPLLRVTPCPVYKEDIVYLFYGKPAYRPHDGVEPTTLPAFLPVSLIFAPIVAPSPVRVMPFDSGAMSGGRFSQFLHPGMRREHFNLGPSLINADRLIGFFFGTARAYYIGTARRDATIPPLSLEAVHYFNLITYEAGSPFDDRRSTIEVQFKDSIDLTLQKVLAVALPGAFMDDPLVKHFVTNVLKAEPLEYRAFHAQPKENVRSIVDLTLEFYSRNGIL